MKILSILLLLATALPAQETVTARRRSAGVGPTPVSAVHSMSGTNGLCSGASTCNYSYPNSAVSGNTLVLVADVNHGTATLSITSLTGSGCPSSFTLVTTAATPNNAIGMTAWTGVAAGSGACTVALSAGGFFSNWDVQSGEFANAVGVDAFGTGANNSGTTLSITAGSPTTVSGDYGIVAWAANANSGSAVATGWTSAFNANFVGAFEESSLSSGLTLPFVGAPIGGLGAENIGIMVVLKA